MEAIAAFIGTVLGAALKQCAPVLRDIIHDAVLAAFARTMEDAKRDPELRSRLVNRIMLPGRVRDADNLHPPR